MENQWSEVAYQETGSILRSVTTIDFKRAICGGQTWVQYIMTYTL